MPAERVAMHQAREIIHLKISACVPTREIARRLGMAASTVRETLRRLESTGLNWPLPDDITDGKLETALYTNRGTKQGHRRHAEPDWPMVHMRLPHLIGVISSPLILPAGRQITTARGYDKDTGLFFEPLGASRLMPPPNA
jgi:Iron dependent repressor, N-terminal DNA binding domain